MDLPDHPLTRNPLTLWNRIFDIRITWPYRLDHNSDTLRSASTLDTQPEHREDSSRYDGEVCEVVTE